MALLQVAWPSHTLLSGGAKLQNRSQQSSPLRLQSPSPCVGWGQRQVLGSWKCVCVWCVCVCNMFGEMEPTPPLSALTAELQEPHFPFKPQQHLPCLPARCRPDLLATALTASPPLRAFQLAALHRRCPFPSSKNQSPHPLLRHTGATAGLGSSQPEGSVWSPPSDRETRHAPRLPGGPRSPRESAG